MGNREDLLAGAKRCLLEKGYGRTTARDIASAAGVSLAAIGYHYGSKDALLTQAMLEAMGEWGDELGRVLSALGGETDPQERFVAAWDKVLESFAEHRGLWAVQIEILARMEQSPELREVLGGAQKEARLGLSAMFQGVPEVPDTPEELARGAFYQALLAGLATQWLVAPDIAPDGREFLQGLRLVGAEVLPGA
ncbi:TetR/AcrR family transcriptional regulator [Kitasatospora sp. NPDC085879]|jgi:AcrR family transcriptional regulator|uniref:TetR/AcrR family transcriptional regulator n=1 Tax=Kitasatospora sp. NPDC085879 TaxID=3154769 RepID=UPI000BB0EF4C|nr:TetR/AcrR family transcriptional regulator [Streptomyces sp. TLI_235]PBC78999.1 TetR family transcriptional regulator [Streptomyces sp. TLI_235]